MTSRVLCAWMVAAVSATALAQGTQMQLASAQVVLTAGGQPVLKLAADGPLAYRVEPADPNGPPTPAQLRLRLYGVTAAPGLTAASVAPYALVATRDGRDTVLTISAVGLPAGLQLAMGTAARASELTVAAR